MKPKFTTLTPEIFDYVCRHSFGGPCREVLDELRAETEALEEISEMMIGKDQGSLLSLLVSSIGAVNAIEVGTFTGYSSICIASGLPKNGRLMCIDQSDEWTQVARRYWKATGVEDKITLRLGDANLILKTLESEDHFDFAFIDADKPGYDAYYELLLPRIRPNGLIMFDNMLRGGRVIHPSKEDENAIALGALNRKLAADARVDSVLLTIGDGINLCRKRQLTSAI